MIDQAPKTRNWQIATLERAEQAAANVKTLVFRVPVWVPHQAGQHYDIRLTAPNGYQAERSYSLANPPEEEGVLSFGVELLENGEVSPYLWNLPLGG
jgi:ferredoxin-NADP reductase